MDKFNSVLEWYDYKWNKPIIFSKKKPAVSLETSLNLGKYPWDPLEAENIMCDFFEVFNVEPSGFSYEAYWPSEGISFLPNFLLPKYLKTNHTPAKNLTLRMFDESAKAGRWLYD